jgi:membrane protease YdiL (CAAX protease family)
MTPREQLRKAVIWVSILLITVCAVLLQRMRPDEDAAVASDEGGFVEERAGSDADAAPKIAHVSTPAELMAKLTVAMHSLAPTVSADQMLGQAEDLKEGAFADRLGYAILLGYFGSWREGIDRAKEIAIPEDAVDEARTLRDGAIRAMELREELAASGDESGEGALNAAEPLRPTLGYFTDVLGPEAVSKASSAIVGVVAAVVWYPLAFLGGLAVLITLLVLSAQGKMAPALEPAASPNTTLVLGETFIIWILAFLSLNVLSVAFIAPALAGFDESLSLLVSVAVMLCSLSVLVYPTLRGVSGAELRRVIGLHTGRGVLSEIGHGVLCYMSAVPLLAAGILVFTILSAIARMLEGPTPPPSHPAVEMLSGAGGLRIFLLYMLASVAAPIVEEIMFRGVLYGHLRSAVLPRVRVGSMVVAALASSVVFAVIHPQGVLFVPALGGLAVAFCIYREMRGSLIAPMVAHGINNAVTMTLGLLLMS